jgi:hypothetical protein
MSLIVPMPSQRAHMPPRTVEGALSRLLAPALSTAIGAAAAR